MVVKLMIKITFIYFDTFIPGESIHNNHSGTNYYFCQLAGSRLVNYSKKKIEHLIYGDHNYGARRAPRPPD